MVCLDTSFLIDLFRGSEAAKERLLGFEAEDEPITIVAPSIMEFSTGAYLAEDSRERKQLRPVISAMPVQAEHLKDRAHALTLVHAIHSHLIATQPLAFDDDVGLVAHLFDTDQ